MTWQRHRRRFHGRQDSLEQPPFRVNQRCFIRKEHECGRVFGASKSCFIACPTGDGLEPMLELLSEKLTKHGIDPVIAVKERAYGQDIFCTKICGKIIESRFCVVILDDVILAEKNIPNPNVYYEYGLMTAFRKQIVPLQKDGQKLAFNIQSYDTVKYSSRNMAAELERAIRDALQVTEDSSEAAENGPVPERLLLRRLELSGFIVRDYNWFLNSVIEDTAFLGFGNDSEPSYVYLGKIDTDDDARTYLEDLDVVLLRTERKATELQAALADTLQRVEAVKTKLGDRYETYHLPYELGQARDAMPGIEAKLQQMRKVYVAFILGAGIAADPFKARVESAVTPFPRFSAVFSSEASITLGRACVALSGGMERA